MKKGKLTPAERFERLRRRAVRKRWKRERQFRAHVQRATEALMDPRPWSNLGWEMNIYGMTIPLDEQVYTRLKRDARPQVIRTGRPQVIRTAVLRRI
jgi:hypothetical protein